MKLNKIILTIMATIMMLSAATKKDDVVNVNFRNLDIKDFVEMVSKITHKNILINGALKGKINFVSTQPIRKSSLIPLANSILQNKGFTLIDQGDFMQVVKASEAAGMGLAVDDKISGETLKTVLFRLKTSNAAVIRAKIKPLLHKNAKVVSFKNNNVLSITAYPRTLKSIKSIIDSVEGAGKKGSTVIRLRNASAKTVYTNALKMAGQLFPKTVPSEKVDVLKDDSTNSIILVGKKENVDRMIRYVKQLDQKGDSVEQKMYVIPLKNSNVEDMEKILSKLVSQMNNMTSRVVKKGGKPPKKAMVVGDAERNALIVLATGDQIKNIRQVIRNIDVEKPQVYIVAKIVEINTGLAQSIGLKYGFEGGRITSKGLFTLAGGTGASSIAMGNTLLDLLKTTKGTGDSQIVKSGISFQGNNIFALGASLNLLKENGAAHILSEPSVLCTNNQESEIYVGETRSILTSSAAGDNKNDNVRNNYSREDIGITLKVKPRLSSRNKVTLTVNAVIEDVLPGSSNSTDRPTTTKRKVTTNAIVNNGETVILGGLIKNGEGTSTSKVPFLGDIPILGKLFSSTSKQRNSVNVVIYITPYIVRRSSDLGKLKRTLNELSAIQDRYNRLIKNALDTKTSGRPQSSVLQGSDGNDAMRALGFGRHRNIQKRVEPEYTETVEPVVIPRSKIKPRPRPKPAPVVVAPRVEPVVYVKPKPVTYVKPEPVAYVQPEPEPIEPVVAPIKKITKKSIKKSQPTTRKLHKLTRFKRREWKIHRPKRLSWVERSSGRSKKHTNSTSDFLNGN